MSIEIEDETHEDGRGELYFAIAAGVTYAGGLLADFVFRAPEPTAAGLYLLTYLFGGYFTVRGAWASIRRAGFCCTGRRERARRGWRAPSLTKVKRNFS